jgi:hypothetical protein
MGRKNSTKPWLRKIVAAVVIAEASYVILFNLALQLPLTQTLINQIRPEKFNIAWESAWTLYPFRFHIRNASGNGQSRSQQWEFETQGVSASIALTPLIFKRVWIDNVRVSDTSYLQRPRIKPDKDYSAHINFYPPISGREITPAVTTPMKKKKPWHVDIEDIRLDGQFDYWVQQFKGQASGTVEADLDVVSRGGLFSLTAPALDLEFGEHYISGEEMFRHGGLSGELAFAPFVPRENKGIKLFRYLLLDTDIDLRVNSLAFINVLTRNFKDLKIDGSGLVDGHVQMEHGQVLEHTALSIDADNLNVEFLSHLIKGHGSVHIGAGPDTGNQFNVDVRFNDLVMKHGGGDSLFSGLGLQLNYKAKNDLFMANRAVEGSENKELNVADKTYELEIKIPAGHVADMSVFNYYFPSNSPFLFGSGTADLVADILLKPDDADGFLKLTANSMQAAIDNQSIQTDFNANLSLVGGVPSDRVFDISGTELQFDNVTVMGENESFEQDYWATLIAFTQADLTFKKPISLKTEANISMTNSRPLVAMLGNQKDRPKWLKNMLTVENIKGVVNLDMADERILIPNAYIDSEKIGFGAKAVIDVGLNDGVIYARYKRLDIVARFSEGKRNIDLVRARKKFDEYRLPAVVE